MSDETMGQALAWVGFVDVSDLLAEDAHLSLVMRKDAVLTLLLNVGLFPGFQCSLMQDPRYLRFSAIENGAVTTYNLKVCLHAPTHPNHAEHVQVANAKIASELLEEIQAIVRQ